MTERYFTQTLAGVAARRYCVLCPRRPATVIRVQVSRPDGIEVERPGGVRFNLQPWNGGSSNGYRRMSFQPAPSLATRTLKCMRCGERKLAQTFPMDPSGRRLRCRECTVERNTRNGTRMRRVQKAAA